MKSVLSVLTLCALVSTARSTKRALVMPCDTAKYTDDGECCEECPPGEGVVRECGATQTVCAPCLDSETYSENYSLTEKCRPCTQCTGFMRMVTPCTDSNNAVCECNYNYYFNGRSAQCEPCTVCPKGQGVYSHCEHSHDTECEECLDETFSDRESYLEPCLPCTICDEESETLVTACTSTTDSVCFNPDLPTSVMVTSEMTDIYPPEEFPGGPDNPSPSREAPTPRPGSPRFLSHDFNKILIPVCCSIVAAVAVGLTAYVVFKRWNSCKQNKQAANNRAAINNQMVTPEGEKLHSDSGISVDTQSLQEQQQQQQQHAQAEVQAQPSRSHTQEQIVVRMDGSPHPDSPPPGV